MRQRVSDKILLAGFIALAAGSVGLKAAAGPARDGFTDGHAGQLDNYLISTLRSQGFATTFVRRRMQSSIVLGRKGQCRIAIRDARAGESYKTVFAWDARDIGPIRYLYRGRVYSVVPGIRYRLIRLGTALLSRFGMTHSASVPVAMATSPGCGADDFGLNDVRIRI